MKPQQPRLSAPTALYSTSLRAGARVRQNGRTEEQWRHILHQTHDTLKDPQKRGAYLTTLTSQEDSHENASLDIELIPPNIPETDSASIPSVNTLQHSDPTAPAIPEIISTPTLANVNVPADMLIIPAGEFLMGRKAFTNGSRVGKSSTWWLKMCDCRGKLAINCFDSVIFI